MEKHNFYLKSNALYIQGPCALCVVDTIDIERNPLVSAKNLGEGYNMVKKVKGRGNGKMIREQQGKR